MGRLLTVKIGKVRRKMILTFLIVQNVLAIAIGMVVCAIAIYVRYTLEAQISFLGKYYNPNAVPGVLFITGLSLISTSSFGVVICFRLRRRERRKDDEEDGSEKENRDEKKPKSNSNRKFYILSIMSLTVFVLLIITIITIFVQKIAVEKAFHKGMTDAMTHYKEKMEVKKDFDLLQINYMCCGVTDYKDWFKAQWIPKKYAENIKADKHGNFNDDVPFSCCDRRLMMPCISEKVTENKAHYKYDHDVNLTLYTTGCKSILSDYYGRVVFKTINLFILFILFLYTWTVLIFRYLQTSNISLSRSEKPIVGWLLTWGAAGKTTADEIVEDSEGTLEDSEVTIGASTDEATEDSEDAMETTTDETYESSDITDDTQEEDD